jgi:DNA-directed RNA polymerase subunit omega
MIFVDRIEKKFAFVLAAALRARQLQGGAPPLVPPGQHKSTRLAMEEILAGEVPYDLPPVPGSEEEEAETKSKAKKKK